MQNLFYLSINKIHLHFFTNEIHAKNHVAFFSFLNIIKNMFSNFFNTAPFLVFIFQKIKKREMTFSRWILKRYEHCFSFFLFVLLLHLIEFALKSLLVLQQIKIIIPFTMCLHGLELNLSPISSLVLKFELDLKQEAVLS